MIRFVQRDAITMASVHGIREVLIINIVKIPNGLLPKGVIGRIKYVVKISPWDEGLELPQSDFCWTIFFFWILWKK